MIRLALLAFGATVQAAAQQPAAQPPSDAQLTMRVDEYMKRMAALGYNGGVLVVRGGKTVFKRS